MSENEAIEPVWRPLGFSLQHHSCHKPWLWVWSREKGIVHFRPAKAGNLDTLVSIHPDFNFWRLAFPNPRRPSGIDPDKAREVFIRLCFAAGEYEPPEELRPRLGRPRKVRSG